MNRNTELHFGNVPKIHQNRSSFDMSHSIKTSWNTGACIPLMVDADVLPGDSITMDQAEVIRLATPIFPTMDNIVADLYWFAVPKRLVWDHWEEFWGQNDDPWARQTEYTEPQIESPSGGWAEGSIADYMGLPTYTDLSGVDSVSALPFRAYAKIMSDWFRDENLKSACHIYTDETTRTGSNGTNYVTDIELGGMPYTAAKLHDRLTSALPSPQKGPSVAIPLGSTAVVKTAQNALLTGAAYPEKWTGTNGTVPANTRMIGVSGGTGNLIGTSGTVGSVDYEAYPNNLYADLSDATAATINQLRTAFAIQKYYEAAGRNGTRYIEYLRSVFGVESSDARLQRSEYLGGQRININIDSVLQTSSTDATTPQGNAAGFSCTVSNDHMFQKSFEEHSIVMCILVCRYEHTYQQGVPKMFSRKKWTDYYNPYFANLGEMPILNKEIYCQGPSVVDTNGNVIDEQVFGYQEAWSEYRYKQNIVTGQMRSNAPTGSLDAWHLADEYQALPTLGSTWIDEDKSNVDRILAVSTSTGVHQFLGDFYFKATYTRCMPIYSVPGLIDHV